MSVALRRVKSVLIGDPLVLITGNFLTCQQATLIIIDATERLSGKSEVSFVCCLSFVNNYNITWVYSAL